MPPTSRPLRRIRPVHAASPRRGWVSVFVAFVLIAFIAIIGLALDTAWTQSTAQQLGAAADAAALAGAHEVLTDNAANQFATTRQRAVATAQANTAGGVQVAIAANLSNDPGGDVVVGRWDAGTRTFVPDTAAPDAVKVTARRASGSNGPLQLFFGPLFGSSSVQISRTAIAEQGAAPDPLILVLDPGRAGALHLNGTSALMDVRAGVVHVNSSNACGIRLDGSPQLLAQEVRVVGDICGTTATPVMSGADVEPDPLAGLPYPTALALPLGPQGRITGPGTYSPGRYPRGVDLSGGTAQLMPGIYSFGNGGGSVGIDLKGDALLTGTEVMVFVEQGARVAVSGSGAGMRLTPPSSGTYAGVALFHHRNNTAANVCRIGGGGIFDVDGTIYVPGGHLDISGTPGKRVGRFIVNTLEASGTAGFTVTGIGVPPPTGPNYVYLVR